MKRYFRKVGSPANAITLVRIICALILIACPTFSARFCLFYGIGGLSDVLDGIAARRMGQETEFGAQLDTAADIVFTTVVIIKTLSAVRFPTWLILWIVCVAVIKCVNAVSGFILYQRFIAEHTLMNKVCGILLFAIPLCIGRLPWQLSKVFVILTCAAATFAAIQEGYYIRGGKEIE